MKLFLRALLLAILGLGALGGGLLWAFTAFTGTYLDPQFLAFQAFLIVASVAFGGFAFLQAKDDYAAYKKANKKPNHVLNATLVLVTVLVLAFAGYKAWQGTQPIQVTITYLNGTTEQPIAGATLYAQDYWGNGRQPDTQTLTTDAEGKGQLSVKRGTSYSIYEKAPKTDTPGPALGQVDTFGVAGTESELILYAGESWFGNSGRSDVFTVKVIDPQGQPIEDADVTFHTTSDTKSSATTDENGQVTLNDNAYGSMPVFVMKDGYQSATSIAQNGDIALVMLTPSA